MANDLTLWEVGTSRTMRAHWMLLELALDYHFHPIGSRTGETQTGEFLQLNPRHKIPVLQHESFVLTESAAIVQYLSNTFASPLIYTAGDNRSRAALDEWCYFIISELDAASLNVVRRHDGLKQIYARRQLRSNPPKATSCTISKRWRRASSVIIHTCSASG
jgi:glutathione S-transferase